MDKITTHQGATEAAWALANAMTNVVGFALAERDLLILSMLHDARREGENMGGMIKYHIAHAVALGIIVQDADGNISTPSPFAVKA